MSGPLAPPVELWERFGDRYRAMDRACVQADQIAPFKVTSWWRDAESNAAVGGVVGSQHLIGLALDLVPRPGVSLAAVAEALRSTRVFELVLVEADHVHAQWFGPGGP